ncbi:MAG: hypothetical protein HKN82_03270 [Akkermansiaceae bacterium]|nr:hypothetical protein [Akkermansiaceae bacterium]NNM28595.1 hypothetical protein [Akkermansiaceae bacterium]
MQHPGHRGSLVARARLPGFALVITISILVLLALVSIALLSLSSITVRSMNRGAAQAEARANARLALMLAIGELQKHAGPDTRVTAPADVIDESHPPLTGVWRSWEGTDHDTGRQFAGRPIAPDYGAKERPATGDGRFLTWLVSTGRRELTTGEVDSLVRKAPFPDSVPLLSGGSLAANDGREVHVEPVALDGGGFAWWISGENQKARLPHPYEPEDDTAARWSVLAKSHAVADPEPFSLETLLDDPAPAAKVITARTADLLAEEGAATRPHEFFHDLSVNSVGLLTNTATGGWRKDLSLLTESWGRQRTSRLPFFRLNARSTTQATRPTPANPVPAGSMLYPWATYRGGNTIPIYQHGPVTSWENLVDFATHYKRVTVARSGRVSTKIHSVAIDTRSENFAFLHRLRILPVIARMQWVFSHSAGTVAGAPRGHVEPRLLLTPVITMWNPYSVEITSPPTLDFRIPKAMPAALRYTIGGTTNRSYNAVMAGVTNQPSLGGGNLRFKINAPFTLKPGETRLFSPASTTPMADNASLTLEPGFRSGGGHFFRVKGPNGQRLTRPRSTTIRAAAKFDTVENDRASGVGMYLDMVFGGRRHLVYRMIYTPEVANAVYPPFRNLAEATLGQALTNPQPFLSTIFGARSASNTHLAAKGFVQSSPFVNYTAMGRKDEVEDTIRRHYGGTAHPVNSPFDYSFVKHAPGGDSLLPNASDRTNRGYIVTGFNKSDGLSRCVIAELPVRPLASLGELVNWDLRYENPIPPYAINLVGNSDASPLLPAGAVVNSRDAGLTENLQYDDSYCANHLLFDDWFFSSIAPNPNHFGGAGRNQKQTYTGFVEGGTPLANRAYRPILEDAATAAAGGAGDLFADHVDPVNSWLTIASRLEVEGMFNVNSTSVTAWRALLGHARNLRVPYINESGRAWKVDLSGETDHALSRFSIAGDSAAGTPGTSGAFPEATEFAGYRTVDDEFLDALAGRVVEQVRARGPFLSLSEFVNRQLSSGDLALAGALQAALNEVARDPATNPFEALEALSTVAVADPPNPRNVAFDEEYAFPDAGVGHSAYGLPGWIRQADILRPLAPVLTARDDTFTIRAYGEARSPAGGLLASAWCEAVVRRTRNFVDAGEEADRTSAPARPANRIFGRRFELVSFRWISPDEV